MANTSFKVENGLLVQGNAQFDYTSKFNANVTIEADQFYIGGNLYVLVHKYSLVVMLRSLIF